MTKILLHFSLKGQSAMEYLMTYGWAILIVAVILAALYQLGFFSGTNFITTSCIAESGFTCQKPVMNITGYVQINLGQISNGTMTISGVGCSNSTSQPYAYYTPPSTSFQPEQLMQVSFQCPGIGNKGSLGSAFRGYVWIQYSVGSQTGLVSQVAVLNAVATTSASLGPTPNIYCIAGYNNNPSWTNLVYAAPVSGTTSGPWVPQPASSYYPITDGLNSCVVSATDIYCIGGLVDGSTATAAVYAAPIFGSSVGSWSAQTTGNYPFTVDSGSCAISGSYIYCVGGLLTSSGPNTNAVEVAQVSGTTVGQWVTQTAGNYPTGTDGGSCVVSGSDIYCIGGQAVYGGGVTNQIYFAPVSGTSVGRWTAETGANNYPTTISQFPCSISGSNVYCIAGYNGIAYTNAVYSAPISGASIGPWTVQAPYPVGISYYSSDSCVASGSVIYCIGGYNGGWTSQIYSAPLSAGTVGTWVAGTHNYPTELGYDSCVG